MNRAKVEEIAAAVLYEGYLLYPYRASSIKNRQRWNFGVLYPRAYADQQSGNDRYLMQTECLLRGDQASVDVHVRFLQVTGQNPQRARERSVEISSIGVGDLLTAPVQRVFSFDAVEESQPLHGSVSVSAALVSNSLYRIRVRVENTSSEPVTDRERAVLSSLVSAHVILAVTGGEFVSLLDPPEDLAEAAKACENIGVWPVLAGEEGSHDVMLASPIILYDYPQIAPESPGALFDGTEIDEILTLRIMTLTDAEKSEMGLTDDHARQILERTENMPPEQFMKLHGVLRDVRETVGDQP